MQAKRMAREMALLTKSPPPGVAAWLRDDARLDLLDAQIIGPSATPYADGIFRLEIVIPTEYPLQPPRLRFLTPIYHPNIDDGGRICLDALNMPPKGAWKPSLNIATILASVQLLLAEPNPEDGLMVDITEEYKTSREVFEEKAKSWTSKHAKGESLAKEESLIKGDSSALEESDRATTSVVQEKSPTEEKRKERADVPINSCIGQEDAFIAHAQREESTEFERRLSPSTKDGERASSNIKQVSGAQSLKNAIRNKNFVVPELVKRPLHEKQQKSTRLRKRRRASGARTDD